MKSFTLVDLAVRALKHPGDYVTALQRHELIFERYIQESESVYSFYFVANERFFWRSGQHGIFKLTSSAAAKDPKRIFSIASAASENHIQISTVISPKPSLFKTQLKALEPGDRVLMHGPIGEFHLPDAPAHIIGVAGGIGITPFRALIKEMIDSNRTDIKMDLLYGCASEARTFSPELDEWAKLPNVTVTYPDGKEDLQSRLTEVSKTLGNTAQYYLSGSPSMIEALRLLLVRQKIKHIIHDPFKGYS